MSNKILIFLFCILNANITDASPSVDQQLNSFRCGKEIKTVLYKNWKANPRWQKLVSTDLNSNQYKTPSDTFGKWIYVTFEKNKIEASLKQLMKLSLFHG